MSSYYPNRESKGYSRSRHASKTPSTLTPEKWVDLTSTEEESFDNPGSPRPARDVRSADEDLGRWGFPARSRGKHIESVQNTDASDIGDEFSGRSADNWGDWDTDIRDAGGDVVPDQDDTWNECGLSTNRRAGKGNWNPKSTRTYESDKDAYRKPAREKQGWSTDEDATHDDSAITSHDNWGSAPVHQTSTRNSRWGAITHDSEDNRPVAQSHAWHDSQNYTTYRTPPIPSTGQTSSWNNIWSTGGDSHAPEARTHASDRPAPRFNYDGNRTALDGSRVFYAAIIPPIPVLSDISNHAEYVAWLDKLKSTLKYHQLDNIIAKDANRPSQHVAARRWDQDKLRAAIIIKGGLGFEVFERVMACGWEDREDPAATIDAIKHAHDSMCSCSLANSMTLLEF